MGGDPIVDRRTFVGTLTIGLLAAPLGAEAQQAGKVPVVGILNSGTGPQSNSIDSIRRGLRELGYVEGKTIALEVRFAGGKSESFPGLVADLIRRKTELLVAIGPAAIRAARGATSTIPIVGIDLESDPVQAGFARSLAQPGGNITGCFLDQAGLTGKWLELIREAAPETRRVAVLVDMTTGPWQLEAIKAAAEKLRIQLHVLEIRTPSEIDSALVGGVKGGSWALVQLSSPLFDLRVVAEQIAHFALKHRLAAISMFRSFPKVGGFMSYGPNQLEYYRRVPAYIDKILRGEKPGDLPVEQPTKFELVINLKTAKALGLTIPPSLLLRADEVIQ